MSEETQSRCAMCRGLEKRKTKLGCYTVEQALNSLCGVKKI